MPWFILVLWACLVILISCLKRETFVATNSSILYATNTLNHHKWLQSVLPKWDTESLSLSSLDTIHTFVRKNKTFPSVLLQNAPNVAYVADPYDSPVLEKALGTPVGMSRKGYFVILGSPQTLFEMKCGFDLTGKRVGYFDLCDARMARALQRSFRIPTQDSTLHPIPLEKWDKLLRVLSEDVDLIITFLIPESPLHELIKSQPIALASFRGLDIDRLKLFYPYVSLEEVNVKEIFTEAAKTSKLLVMAKDSDGPLLSMQMPVYRIQGSYLPKGKENFITQVTFSPEALDPSYRCYGDLSILQKGLCESPFGTFGEMKRKTNYWDRPCVKNTDCPFYQANKNYKNQRGGCLKGGVCEMPVGVKRIAYRTYDDQGGNAPFCYSCKRPSDPSCCKTQEKPDYAFPNDTAERKKAKLPTIVSME